MEKCLRLLCAESGSFSLPEKSMISLYVSNTFKYILQTQVMYFIIHGISHHFYFDGHLDA